MEGLRMGVEVEKILGAVEEAVWIMLYSEAPKVGEEKGGGKGGEVATGLCMGL